MNYEELDCCLMKITSSEKCHLKNPNKISEFHIKVDYAFMCNCFHEL